MTSFRGITWEDVPGTDRLDKMNRFLGLKMKGSRYMRGAQGLEGEALKLHVVGLYNEMKARNLKNRQNQQAQSGGLSKVGRRAIVPDEPVRPVSASLP